MVYSYKHGQPAQQSNEIRDFQAKLNAIRSAWNGQWPRLTADGIYGRNTRDAVKAFQIFANVIPVTGNLDSATQTAINNKYIESKRTHSSYSASYGNYQPANANYTMGGSTTSSFDQVWKKHESDIKSIVQDISSIIGEIVNVAGPKYLCNRFIQNTSKLMATRTKYAGIMEQIGRELKELDNVIDDFYLDHLHQSALIKDDHKFIPKTNLYKSFKNLNVENNLPNIKVYNPSNLKNVEKILKSYQSKQLLKVFVNFERARLTYNANSTQIMDNAAAITHERMTRSLPKEISASKSLSKGLSAAGYYIDIWNVVFYASKWGWAQSEAENQKCRKEFKKTLKNALGSIAVNATTDLLVSGAVHATAKVGTGAAAGPVGIAITTVVGVLDIVLVMATGESISDRLTPYLIRLENLAMDPYLNQMTSLAHDDNPTLGKVTGGRGLHYGW